MIANGGGNEVLQQARESLIFHKRISILVTAEPGRVVASGNGNIRMAGE